MISLCAAIKMMRAALIVCCSTSAWAATPSGFELVWSDEFNYEGAPDPSKWTYEEGIIRNHEAQYYTRDRRENVRVENGTLVIEARKEDFKNPRFDPGTKDWRHDVEVAHYTSGSVITQGKASWRYGRIEIRAKIPQGLGVWPALWTLGINIPEVDWPRCGEIDILEFVGHDPERIHAHVHYAVEGKHQAKGGKIRTLRPFDDFHVYTVEWDEERIRIFFDETEYFCAALDEVGGPGEDNPFRKPHYLMMNLALGGSWGKEIDDRILPQRFLIDYVRIYQKPAHLKAASAR